MQIETLKFLKGLAEAQATIATLSWVALKSADSDLSSLEIKEKLRDLSNKLSEENDFITAQRILFERELRKE